MKIFIKFGIIILALLLTNCSKMEDNYKDYLNNVKIYSPRVTNLSAVSGLRVATLSWKNPSGNIAQKNLICFEDSTIILEPMVETYTLTNLEIKGYKVSVYTIDQYNNYSVPASISIFPNGESNF